MRSFSAPLDDIATDKMNDSMLISRTVAAFMFFTS
jgi:hypothetical protein